eukprot:TRINITY_DN11320_c0_g1_i11.p1 TRINITY_DN11320_c0_g1~~TRINITY_DN11320_c0_g1_i11.p1  ORF type:complete len:217 (-),score=-24.88 TRINITY_DN11320_c0_g1_i11:845-1495(-)
MYSIGSVVLGYNSFLYFRPVSIGFPFTEKSILTERSLFQILVYCSSKNYQYIQVVSVQSNISTINYCQDFIIACIKVKLNQLIFILLLNSNDFVKRVCYNAAIKMKQICNLFQSFFNNAFKISQFNCFYDHKLKIELFSKLYQDLFFVSKLFMQAQDSSLQFAWLDRYQGVNLYPSNILCQYQYILVIYILQFQRVQFIINHKFIIYIFSLSCFVV